MRYSSVDAGPSSYCYSTGPYDYDEPGLADRFYNIVHAADHPFWDSCTQSQLGDVAEFVDIKADGHISERIYDRISQLANKILPLIILCQKIITAQKKLVKDLGLPIEKIDACTSLPKDETHIGKKSPLSNPKRLIDVYLEPLIEELLQLWHVSVRTYDHATDNAFIMQHGRKAFYFDWYRQFLSEHHPYQRNKKAFTKNRIKNKIARLRLIGDQLLDRVANISLAVEIPLSLPDGYGSDHKWTKKTIFWDLSYWSTLLIQHNLDVIHIEKNMFDNIFNTIMDIKGKIKDNMNAHRDLKIICNRPELELDECRPNIMPKAVYTLAKERKRRVCE
ncbi:hypothetical protein Sango_2330900 [Sesamum angolense]|uniref:Uncharacterized protein n=1 Tax=Sesamum angolense TaxID=2727404 RepID=A0AAE1WB42_9LAMI|nr:hypothetical protein Sango_2330900 [Sesamum angolense]